MSGDNPARMPTAPAKPREKATGTPSARKAMKPSIIQTSGLIGHSPAQTVKGHLAKAPGHSDSQDRQPDHIPPVGQAQARGFELPLIFLPGEYTAIPDHQTQHGHAAQPLEHNQRLAQAWQLVLDQCDANMPVAAHG